MGNKIKKIRTTLMGILLLSATVFCGAANAEGEPSLEQVYTNMPEVKVYGTGIAGGTEARLGQESLQFVRETTFGETGEPVYYYVLLDVSNSMPEDYFQQIKDSICRFEQGLKPQDRMALYTFGETVNLVLPEEHDRAETYAAMQPIDNIDNRTLLFEAIKIAADRADQVQPEVCQRRVLVVISDGEDFTIGGTGAQEAQDALKQKGIPAYAYGIQDTARENINNFGNFARISGGKLTVFGAAEAPVLLDTLSMEMAAANVLEYRSSNNISTNRLEPFSLHLLTGETLTWETPVYRHIADLTIPILVRAEKVADDQVEIEFSEPVTGADNASAYIVKCDDGKKKDKGDKDKGDKDTESEDENSERDESEDSKSNEDDKNIIAVSSVSVSTDDPNVYLLTFQSDLKAGDYTITCTNITDLSMESNPVSGKAEFEVEQPPLGKRILGAIREWYWIFLILVILALILVAVHIYRKVKKGQGVLYVDGKPVMASGVEVHKHVALKEAEAGKPFWLRVSVKGGRPEEMAFHINRSFIVGRSNICNLYFDDKRMSRQHFVLEWNGTDMSIEDLNTTNGTLVNNVRINQKRRLQQNDKITAGAVEFTIRW